MKKYVVTEYEDSKPLDNDVKEKSIKVINEEELWNLIQDEGSKTDIHERLNISISELGDCVIDWSFNWKSM